MRFFNFKRFIFRGPFGLILSITYILSVFYILAIFTRLFKKDRVFFREYFLKKKSLLRNIQYVECNEVSLLLVGVL